MKMGASMDLVGAISIAAAVFSIGSAIFIFFHQRRERRFDFLEQSFDALQRINEKALESDENVLAAIRSANPADETSAEEGRHIYFHYMRINRIFRAYEFMRGGFLGPSDAERIIGPQLGTLVSIVPQLPPILERGYPADFRDYLLQRVSAAEMSARIR
jgi:hypothetical protein